MVKLPIKLPPGEHRVVVVVDAEYEQGERPPLKFSAYPVAPTSQTTFRREDIYDDDGR